MLEGSNLLLLLPHTRLPAALEAFNLLLKIVYSPIFFGRISLPKLPVVQLQPLCSEMEDLQLKIGDLQAQFDQIGESIVLIGQLLEAEFKCFFQSLAEPFLLNQLIFT